MGYRMFRRLFCVDYGFNQRIACQPITTVQARASTFTDGIQTIDRRARIQVDLDTAAKVVCTRRNGNILFGNVYTDRQTFGIDIWKVMFRLFRIFMRHV